MDNNDGDASTFSNARGILRRMQRSDSIPEDRESIEGAAVTANASIGELLMRHSSPLLNRRTGEAVTSPLAERNSSPSPLRLNRPRSNPRSRTPMRIPEDEEEQDDIPITENESSRITIRLGSGRGVGTGTVTYGSRRSRKEQSARVKSNKQGPSHRKTRRWNNDNFVNLAAELSGTKGSASAVEALLKGSAEASKHRSILDYKQYESKAMKKFREDDQLSSVRDQFFEGSLPHNKNSSSLSSKRKVVIDYDSLSPQERFLRIEKRLRRILVKACENSYAASKVVNTFEEFLIQTYDGRECDLSAKKWQEILLESPIVTSPECKMTLEHKNQDSEITGSPSLSKRDFNIKFLFDADSTTGGFHRLLLHGVCQFHCLKATSSTSCFNGKTTRVLTATGTFSGANIHLVDYITDRQKGASNSINTGGSYTSSPDAAFSEKLSVLKI